MTQATYNLLLDEEMLSHSTGKAQQFPVVQPASHGKPLDAVELLPQPFGK